MSNSNRNSGNTTIVNGGVGFFGLLTIVLIALKLTGIIDPSWWWVLVFVWAPIALVLGSTIIGFILSMLFNRR